MFLLNLTPRQYLILWAITALREDDAIRGDHDHALVEMEYLEEQPTTEELTEIVAELKRHLRPSMGGKS